MIKPILVVDDSLTVRMDLADALSGAGFRALACSNLREARNLLAQHEIGLMILDVRLPDGDGIEFLAELRATPAGAHLPVLVLSSAAEVSDRIRGMQLGATDYVGKPYDTGYVLSRALSLLNAPSDPGAPGAAFTVLLIDDSPTFREALREALAAHGYTVLCASDGEEGLRVAAAQRPSVIVVDGVLPGIDGATVIRRIRLDAALRHTPCLLLTGSDSANAELHALDAGADAFVRKEEALATVLARLSTVLRGSTREPLASDDTVSVLGAKKILAIDDVPARLSELTIALQGEGYDLVGARSGEQALELLAAQRVDCVLLGWMAGAPSGLEICELIRAAPFARDIPLIMLASAEDRSALLSALGAGADDCVQLDSDLEVLRARVRAQLRRKQGELQTRHAREQLLHRELQAAEARSARVLSEARAQMVDELERKNRELEAFSYSVSHDLRAPLRSIDGFSQALLEDYIEVLDERGQDSLRRVRSAAQRMGELIDDLLQLSRVGRAELKSEPLDLSALARGVLAQLQQSEPTRRVECVIEDGLTALGDRRLLLIALENLLGNAWKFTRKTEAARIELGVFDGTEPQAFFVRDNGAGFDMRNVGKLFRPFQRLHSASEFSGTGIGLATVQRIVDRHGGRVWASAQPNAGAVFQFTLQSKRGS